MNRHGPENAQSFFQSIKEYIGEKMKLTGQGRELGKVDWKGSEGAGVVEAILTETVGNILDSVVMNIEVAINPAESTPHESALIELRVPGVEEPFRLDIDVTTLLRHSHNVSEIAKDFLLIAAVVYGCDKAVDRNDSSISEDRWKRDISIAIPVLFPDRWQSVADTLEDCVGFLTGDDWEIKFVASARDLIQRRRRKRRSRLRFSRPFEPDAVSLFSGGLIHSLGHWTG